MWRKNDKQLIREKIGVIVIKIWLMIEWTFDFLEKTTDSEYGEKIIENVQNTQYMNCGKVKNLIVHNNSWKK